MTPQAYDREREARYAYVDALGAAQQLIRDEVMGLVHHCDMNATIAVLPTVTDYSKPAAPSGYRPRMAQTLGMALYDAMDSGPGFEPFYEAFALLCRAARGDAVQADARAMLDRMAWRLGEMHAEVDE